MCEGLAKVGPRESEFAQALKTSFDGFGWIWSDKVRGNDPQRKDERVGTKCAPLAGQDAHMCGGGAFRPEACERKPREGRRQKAPGTRESVA